MNWEIAFVLLLLLGAVVSFIREKVSPDVTSLSVFALLVGVAALIPGSRLPKVDELLLVFANPAPVTIACMFVLSKGLEATGVIAEMVRVLEKTTRLGYRRFLAVMVVVVALISAFINNTPVVVVLLPVVISLARSLRVPAAKLLIPLSYASIFGGVCTLLGTSTNILASSIVADRGLEPIRMFEIGAIGLPLLLLGTLYLMLFGRRLLPNHETLASLVPEEARKEYLAEAFVPPASGAVGKTIRELGIHRMSGIRVVEIMRRGIPIKGDLRDSRVEAGDRLVLACRPHGVAEARSVEGIALEAERGLELEPITAREASIVEALVPPDSTFIGRTIQEMGLRQQYRILVVALHRRGHNIRLEQEDVRIEAGDNLLMLGSNESLDTLRRGNDLLLLDQPRIPARSRRRRAPVAVGTFAAVVALATFNLLPIAAATIVGVAALILSGCLRAKEAYQSVEWSILILIYGMLGLGLAMETSGATGLITGGITGLLETGIPPAWQPLALLILVYAIGSILTEFLSNNATIVLIVPVAVSLANNFGIDPRPFIIACCVASSASFATPIGYQTNTLVYGVGGYKFRDFLRIGLPLNLLYGVGTVILAPLIWPFHP